MGHVSATVEDGGEAFASVPKLQFMQDRCKRVPARPVVRTVEDE